MKRPNINIEVNLDETKDVKEETEIDKKDPEYTTESWNVSGYERKDGTVVPGYVSNRNPDLLKKMDDIVISFKLDAETQRPLTCLNGEVVEDEIRQMEVSRFVSLIAAIPFVREALTLQQQILGNEKGIVMDGRDIGTTVFPDAEMKVFVTASAEVRAKRRYDELLAKGESHVNYDEILRNVKERDEIDQNRKVSPLRKADDALLLDNGNMTREEQDEWLMQRFNEIVNK